MNIDLSIIIPAYKEEERIAASLTELAQWLKGHHYGQVEVLVVGVAGDATTTVAQTKSSLFEHFRLVLPKQKTGKGGAVRIGMFEAQGRYRLFMDADLATPLRHLDEVYQLMSRNEDVGIAVRNLWRIHKGLVRKLVTKVANLVVQVLLVPGIKDTQCGFKVFSAKAATEIFARQTLTRWSFDVEILKIARLLGYRISYIEAPDWRDPKKVGLVGESPLKIALAEFKDPFVVLWRWLTGKYRQPTYHYRRDQELLQTG